MSRRYILRYDIWICLALAFLASLGVEALVKSNRESQYEDYKTEHVVESDAVGGPATDVIFRAENIKDLENHDTFTVISPGIEYRNRGAGYYNGMYLYALTLPSGEIVAARINTENVTKVNPDDSYYTGNTILPVGRLIKANLEDHETFLHQIDFNGSPAANVATCIILEKMLQFRDDGTYEASINPHRKHDCEAEGCNNAKASTVLTAPPVVRDVLELSETMTDAEIIAYLDDQRTVSITQFDLQHPNLYFDQFGHVHGATDPDEERYYATSINQVYRLDDPYDVYCISENSLYDMNLHGTYVGTTNRRLG